jgi:hypothetical protein
MDTQRKYALEMQARYLKYLQQENENENKVIAHVQKERVEKEKRRLRRKNTIALSAEDADETANLTMDRYVPSRYRIFNMIIDSEHRDKTAYPDATNFVVKLQETLRDVAAIRTMRTEFYLSNDKTVHLEPAYLYLNGYISTIVANDTSVALFGRIGPGTDMYPAVTGDPFKDPYVYLMRPVEPRMKRFHVGLLTHDGQPYPTTDIRVVLILAVYCLM